MCVEFWFLDAKVEKKSETCKLCLFFLYENGNIQDQQNDESV